MVLMYYHLLTFTCIACSIFFSPPAFSNADWSPVLAITEEREGDVEGKGEGEF